MKSQISLLAHGLLINYVMVFHKFYIILYGLLLIQSGKEDCVKAIDSLIVLEAKVTKLSGLIDLYKKSILKAKNRKFRIGIEITIILIYLIVIYGGLIYFIDELIKFVSMLSALNPLRIIFALSIFLLPIVFLYMLFLKEVALLNLIKISEINKLLNDRNSQIVSYWIKEHRLNKRDIEKVVLPYIKEEIMLNEHYSLSRFSTSMIPALTVGFLSGIFVHILTVASYDEQAWNELGPDGVYTLIFNGIFSIAIIVLILSGMIFKVVPMFRVFSRGSTLRRIEKVLFAFLLESKDENDKSNIHLAETLFQANKSSHHVSYNFKRDV